ncbi:bifunctional chorismate-binding protein/class IV aminotransferase [Dichelobacter nodosus]|uniref:bifunctional chorismate-binding protein/class IV aminotransferase n=1 Tax=Dichelobacter nodosus TaxID=870 RepID=UPI000E298DDA|nr:bifunctional anthranilate synthase component I family protein/class IV aminotransferase [Dichelobacter nodosus]AXM45513.1 bifunctional aminodeoxychorismate synthase component I/aminodeoxychorismate lyase [Dichelobacter nodosus]
MNSPFALLDNICEERARHYHHFHHRDTLTAEQLDQLDALLYQGWQQGLHCTLRIPYELGLALYRLPTKPAALAIDWYQDCHMLTRQQIPDLLNEAINRLDNPLQGMFIDAHYSVSEDDYRDFIDRIHQHILAGDVYQINFTLERTAHFTGDPLLLYQRLRQRQPVPYAALMYHPDDGYTLCLSPECFLTIHGREITTEPMKGTLAKPAAAADVAAAKNALAHDEKNRAENAMIVDLLRNDLSKIAEPFGVRVENPFHVAAFGSVLQMTTKIRAKMSYGCGLSDIIRATFPCGSITGAPKKMAMHIIDQLENRPRGIYTGSIGYVEPLANGRIHSVLNVAIRTLTIQNQIARFGVGGGITIDSSAEGEYEECRVKTRFLNLPPEINLFETLRVESGNVLRLDAHLQRLKNSAAALSLPTVDIIKLKERLQRLAAQQDDAPQRLKITLSKANLSVNVDPLPQKAPAPRCLLYPDALPDEDILRCYKTSYRGIFDAAWQFAVKNQAFDALFFNQSGFLLEGGRSNVFLCIDHQWYTPPLQLHILAGVMRQTILEQPELIGAERILQEKLTAFDVQRAEKIILTNSLRGIIPVTLIDVT